MKLELANARADRIIEYISRNKPASITARKALIKQYNKFVKLAIVEKYSAASEKKTVDYDWIEPEICEICFDEILIGSKMRVLPCGHLVDAECAEHWYIIRPLNCRKCGTPLKDGLRNDFLNVDNQVLRDAIVRQFTIGKQE